MMIFKFIIMMENYEKKYKEALERAKDLHDNHPYGEPPIWTTCEKIFPELKESEDERIRKGLIKGLSVLRDIHKHQTFSDDAINIDEAIAWLEKQGEQKPAWSEEDENNIKCICSYLELHLNHAADINEIEECKYLKDWLKSLKPNNWKPSEEQMEALKNIIIGRRGPLYDLYFDLEKL